MLVIPLASIVWVVLTGVVLPFDQLRFLLVAGGLAMVSFVVLWWASFGRAWRSRRLIPLTLFLLCLWLGGGVLLIAKLNVVFDFDKTPEVHLRKIVDARLTTAGRGVRSGASTSARKCYVTLDQPVASVGAVWLPTGDCVAIRPHVDGLSVLLSPGALRMPWARQTVLVQDVDVVRTRQGIPQAPVNPPVRQTP